MGVSYLLSVMFTSFGLVIYQLIWCEQKSSTEANKDSHGVAFVAKAVASYQRLLMQLLLLLLLLLLLCFDVATVAVVAVVAVAGCCHHPSYATAKWHIA